MRLPEHDFCRLETGQFLVGMLAFVVPGGDDEEMQISDGHVG